MVMISWKEKMAICKEYPRVHIVRTMKQRSKRNHYYMVEDAGPMRLLRRLRGEPETPRRKGGVTYSHNRSEL